MKNKCLLVAALMMIASCACQKKADDVPVKEGPEHVFVGYVTWWDDIMPDLQYITHLNYAFGKVADSFDRVEIENPSRLQDFVKLRPYYPNLKIMLSIGGWGAGNFSEMAADPTLRHRFCLSCLEQCETFGLDGIDLDWEYPTSDAADISCSPDDTENFTLLVRDLRETLGPDRLLTMASSADADYVDFRSCVEYFDFVNLMTYDMGWPPEHNAALYPSDKSGLSVDEAVTLHHEAGVPFAKMVVGVPFYGRIPDSDDCIDFRHLSLSGYNRCWDSEAMVPYLVDASGRMAISYDDAQSITLKGEYIVSRHLLGAMVWNLEADDSHWTLTTALHSAMEK